MIIYALFLGWILDGAVASDVRRLGPKTCHSKVYNRRDEKPSQIDDSSGACNPEGSSRAFLLDTSQPTHNPKLRAGFGLGVKDAVALIDANEECGDTKTSPSVIGYVTREALTRSVAAYDEAGRAIPHKDIYAVVDVKGERLEQEKAYKVCYAPFLGMRENQIIQPADFLYTAGLLRVENSLFSCDFNTKTSPLCGLFSYKDNFDIDLEWDVGRGMSNRPGTGPLGDASSVDGDGGYALMRSPGYLTDGAAAVMVGTPLLGPAGDYCVSFRYNMHGDDVNSLRVYAPEISLVKGANSEGEIRQDFGRWGNPSWVAVGNKGEKWHTGGFNVHFEEAVGRQLVFEAVAGKSEKGDIAIDDLSVRKGDCPADVRSMPRSRVGTKDMVCGEVRMITGQHPQDKAWSLEGAVSCAGRGYSMADVEHAWVPCCVPHFGTYELRLRDKLNDGWEGSKLELRFFDRVMTFGKEMQPHVGDVTLPVVIGQLEIRSAAYKDSAIETDVSVVQPNSLVWCGVAEAAQDGTVRGPPPHKKLMKEYGVKYPRATSRANEVVTIKIHGNFISPRKMYDVYCFTEPSDLDLRRSLNETEELTLMDDNQILASRFRITADAQPPVVSLDEVQVESVKVIARIHVDEPCVAWCLPVITSAASTVSVDLMKSTGQKMKFAEDNLKGAYEFPDLASDTDYQLFCYAEDFSEPVVNRMEESVLKKGGLGDKPITFHTQKKAPTPSIERVSNIAAGFDVFVTLDGPGKVFCAAGPDGVDFPSVRDVKSAGASGELSVKNFATDPHQQLRVAIRGVQAQTPYTVFCFASTLDETLTTREKEMWKNAHPVTSFGKFCDLPASPSITVRDDTATPFDPMTNDEELAVRRFILKTSDLGIESVYRVNLLPNKTEIYNFYRKGGEMPKRYARVRAGRCLDGDRGFYEQLKVGPLDEDEDSFTWERIAQPVETQCGGYSVEGIFGRRLSDSSLTLTKLLKESFGYPFSGAECSLGEVHNECLRVGAVAFDAHKDESRRKLSTAEEVEPLWVGLKTPSGEPVPFYFKVLPSSLNIKNAKEVDLRALPRMLDSVDWMSTVVQYWYNGKEFSNVDDLLRAYENNEIERLTPEKLQERREVSRRESAAKRRLAPAPYPGAAGTAGQDLDRSRKRRGLESRVPPEHVEPGGKRYQIKSHPGGQSFSIDYAGWSFTVTNDRDKSMQFWNVRFQDEQLAFQLGLQEALAHYTVSERTFFFLDSWYGGLGGAARPVLRGYECPKHGVLLFFDQSLCVWEQDMARPIRSHYRSGEIRDASGHYALHVRQMLTVSNYDYVTTYVFHSSGHVEMKVEFTGELYAGVEVPWWSSRQEHYGTQVTGAMRFAALHAHAVVWKIDFDLGDDFNDNSVFFEEVVPDPHRVGANYIDRKFPSGELDAIIGVNATRSIAYEIVDEKRNTYGNYGGWRIFPGHSWSPNQPHAELYSGPAAWAKYRAFSTVYKYSELDATLPRDNKFAGDPAVCVDRYFADNETLRHTDVVAWMSMAFMHIPCAEDYPLTIPIGNTLSALIRPNNWFLEDPSMDLHNAIGGDFKDPGQCAVVRRDLFEAMDVKNSRGPMVL